MHINIFDASNIFPYIVPQNSIVVANSARQELQDTLRNVSDHLSFLYSALASLLNLSSALKFSFNHAAQCQSFACVAPCGTAC